MNDAMTEMNRYFIKAVSHGDVAGALNCLEQGAHTEYLSGGGLFGSPVRALTIAARRGDMAMVSMLLSRGADIDAKNDNGRTALCEAIHARKFDVATELLSRGADPAVEDNATLCAYHYAAQEGFELLNAGRDKYKRRLHHSYHAGGVIESLNADLISAVKAGRVDKARHAIHCGAWPWAVRVSEISGNVSAMRLAVRRGYADIVQLLAESGASVNNDQTSMTESLLTEAINRGQYDVAALLLTLGADPCSGAAQAAANAGWHGYMVHPSVIAHAEKSRVQPELPPPAVDSITIESRVEGLKMKEIFNFRTHERISLVYNKSGAEVTAMTRESFSAIDSKETLKHAFDLYRRAGGKIEEVEAFHHGIDKSPLKLPGAGQ